MGRGSSARDSGSKRKSALDLSVQDASAALPQNCQTTIRILDFSYAAVNVTLVTDKSCRNKELAPDEKDGKKKDEKKKDEKKLR
jgi:hypothetical protein